MAYDLEGTLLEVCACNILCPCWVGEDPDGGTCDAVLAYHIERGSVDGTDVTGRTVAAIGDIPGNVLKGNWKIALFVDVTPNANIHVYAPGSKDYIPITVKPEPQPQMKFGKVTYPKADVMTFADEKVPVFQKPFRLTQDATIDKSAKSGSTLTIPGIVNFQACDDKVCYPPEKVAVSWTVAVK